MWTTRPKSSLKAIQFVTLLCLCNHPSLYAQQTGHPYDGVILPTLPEVRRPFVLEAVNDPTNGKGAFLFEGREVPPVIRTEPGGMIRVEYVNHMSKESKESCVDGPCMNMTNSAFSWASRLPEFSSGRRSFHDGHAWPSAAIRG
jgi:hypothetical protein